VNTTPSAAHPTALPRQGLFDRDWQKALILMLTLLAGLALLRALWQVSGPLLHTLVLGALGAVLAAVILVGGLAVLAGPFAGRAARHW
jgi:hypothetical protein